MAYKSSGHSIPVQCDAEGHALCPCHHMRLVRHPSEPDLWGCPIMAEAEAEVRTALRSVAEAFLAEQTQTEREAER